MHAVFLAWYRRRFAARRPPDAPCVPGDFDVARALIAAIDRGGIPLNPARVSAIARRLGLEVSARAPVEQTIARIRACLERADSLRPPT